MMISIKNIISATAITLLGLQLSACAYLQPPPKPVQKPIRSNPLYLDEIPIGIAFIPQQPQLEVVNKRPAIALSVRTEKSNWVAIGPAKMVSIAHPHEQAVLQMACGGFNSQFIQNYGRFRVHECVGRQTRYSDIDIIKRYGLPISLYY